MFFYTEQVANKADDKSLPTLFMENTDTRAKQAAFDNKSAYAGDLTAEANDEVGIDQLGIAAGLDIQPESPLSVAADLKARDENRAELIPTADDFAPDTATADIPPVSDSPPA